MQSGSLLLSIVFVIIYTVEPRSIRYVRDAPSVIASSLDTIDHSVELESMGFHADGMGGFINHEASFDGRHRPKPYAPYRSRHGFAVPTPDPAGAQDAGKLSNHEAIKYTLDGQGGLGGQGAVVHSGSYIPGSTVNNDPAFSKVLKN